MSNFNRFKSSSIFGTFQNSDTPDNSILANGIFDRNLTIKNNLNIGLETGTPVLDMSGNVINTIYNSTGGNINFDFNGISYSIGKPQLIKLLNNLATETFVNTSIQNAIQSLINNSPVSLDTLQELANALGNDPNFATTISNNLGLKANINNPTFTGTITTPNLITSTMSLNGNLTTNSTTLTPIEISRLTGITSNIQTQINSRSSLSGNNNFTGDNNFPYLRLNGTNYIITNSLTLLSNMTGGNNLIMGPNAGINLTTGGPNVFIGGGAGQFLNTSNSIFIGFLAGQGVSGVSLNQNWENIGIGRQVMPVITTGRTNTSVGHLSTQVLTTGIFNTALGARTFPQLTTGQNNTAVGNRSGANVVGHILNTFLGTDSRLIATNNGGITNSTAIGFNSEISATNQIVLGGVNASIFPTVFIPSGRLTLGETYRTGTYNIDLIGNINTTTGYFDNGVNINTIYQPISSMTNYYLKSEIDNTFLNYYTKTQVDAISFNNNNALTNYYNKTETDNFLNLKANLSNPSFSGTVTIPTLTNTTSISSPSVFVSTNLNIQSTANLNLLGNIFCQTQAITISPLELSYLDNVSSNIQNQINTANTNITTLQNNTSNINNTSDLNKPISNATQNDLNLKANLSNPSFSGTVTIPTLTNTTSISSPSVLVSTNLNIQSTANLNLLGNIFCQSQLITISPLELSYLDNVSSNIQNQINSANTNINNLTNQLLDVYTKTQSETIFLNETDAINDYGRLVFPNNWINRNNFNRIVVNSNNATSTTGRGDIESTQGLHIQWNRTTIGNGQTYLMNHKGGASGNGGFIFQRYNGSGIYFDEPLLIGDNIQMNNNLIMNGSSTITASTITASTITANTQINTNVLNPISGGKITSSAPIIQPNTVGAYFIDSTLSGFLLDKTYPIFCSTKDLGNRDDAFIVMPGYRLDLFEFTNYISLLVSINNVGGTIPLVLSSTTLYSGNTGRIGSCRLFYNTTEITLSIFS